ncbi:MAG: 3-ketoacyl-ACP reductase [Phycisphaerae bacterium]|nr:3-ketoacyl-ACP reductase [Phycisphaerae bacterium]
MSRPVAIVTGAGRGIGQAVAVALGAGGWRVVVNYRSSAAGAAETRGRIEAAGGEALELAADVSVEVDRHRLVDGAVEGFGRIDLLVNNAGITSPDRHLDLLETTEAGFDQLMGINLKGPFFLTQAAARWMVAHPDPQMFRAVINISSLSAYAVSTNRADYCMAKSALGMMTRVWAARLAEHGIAVYEILPGIIESDMTAGVHEQYDRRIREEDLLPIARWGQPEDVAGAVVMLGEGKLAYSTGESINVDGGFHIRRL